MRSIQGDDGSAYIIQMRIIILMGCCHIIAIYCASSRLNILYIEEVNIFVCIYCIHVRRIRTVGNNMCESDAHKMCAAHTFEYIQDLRLVLCQYSVYVEVRCVRLLDTYIRVYMVEAIN